MLGAVGGDGPLGVLGRMLPARLRDQGAASACGRRVRELRAYIWVALLPSARQRLSALRCVASWTVRCNIFEHGERASVATHFFYYFSGELLSLLPAV